MRKREIPWGKLAAILSILSVLAGVSIFGGRLVSLEARAESHLSAAGNEAAQMAAMGATIKLTCERIARIESQVDDLHRALIAPHRDGSRDSAIAAAGGVK